MNFTYKEIDDVHNGLIAVEVSIWNTKQLPKLEDANKAMDGMEDEYGVCFINDLGDDDLIVSFNAVAGNMDTYIKNTVNAIMFNLTGEE